MLFAIGVMVLCTIVGGALMYLDMKHFARYPLETTWEVVKWTTGGAILGFMFSFVVFIIMSAIMGGA